MVKEDNIIEIIGFFDTVCDNGCPPTAKCEDYKTENHNEVDCGQCLYREVEKLLENIIKNEQG